MFLKVLTHDRKTALGRIETFKFETNWREKKATFR
jgi:hypothetical protein